MGAVPLLFISCLISYRPKKARAHDSCAMAHTTVAPWQAVPILVLLVPHTAPPLTYRGAAHVVLPRQAFAVQAVGRGVGGWGVCQVGVGIPGDMERGI